MKILILGASGMLGHRLFIELSKHHEVHGTYTGWKQFLPEDKVTHLGIGTGNWRFHLIDVFQNTKPDVVINCIAKVHPTDDRFGKLDCIELNAAFPYELMYIAHEHDARLIHFSTDGVFSGNRGNYTEDDTPDATDTYGTTKRLGEISDMEHVLTLRCCPIGRELPLSAKHSLVEWFLAQTGEVKGYINAHFNPLTTHEIADLLLEHVLPRPDLHGLYHIGGSTWQKAVILHRLNDLYKRNLEIIPDGSVQCNRVLSTRKFDNETGYKARPLSDMLEMMRAENVMYEGVHAHE